MGLSKVFNESDLLELFSLTTPNWITWYTKSDQYSREKLNGDIEDLKKKYHSIQHHRKNYMINREYINKEDEYCTPQVFSLAEDFLDKNKNSTLRRKQHFFLD